MTKKTTAFKNFFFSEFTLAEGLDAAGLGPAVLIRTGTFSHPKAPDGKFTITNETLQSFKNNFDNNVRRLDKSEIALDYGHKTEGPASGWIEAVEHRQDGTEGELEIVPRWTINGEKAILEEEYKFLSADIDFEYIDNETGVNHGPTLLGGGLVNRPHIKAMKALFNEQNNIKPKQEFSMTPEEMAKKIGELEQLVSSLRSENESLKSKVSNGEDTEKELGEKLENSEKSLKEEKEKNLTLTEEKINVSKEAKFNEYLNAGKVIPAQKDAFMEMTLELSEKVYKDAPTLNLSEQGTGKEKKEGAKDGEKNAVDLVEAKADEKIKNNPKLTLSEAYSEVLTEDSDLAEKYNSEVNG